MSSKYNRALSILGKFLYSTLTVLVLGTLLFSSNGFSATNGFRSADKFSTVSSVQAQETGWSEPVMISTNTVRSWFSDVTVDDWGQPHVVWFSSRATGKEPMDLLMYNTLDKDQALEWREPNDIVLAGYGGYTVRTAIAADKTGKLHVTFRGGTIVYYVNAPVSEAWNAATWTQRKRISGTGTDVAYYSDIATDESNGIHVVWNESVASGVEESWLWFGTPTGALAYESQEWQPKSIAEEVKTQAIHEIIEDNSGALWIASNAGVLRFDGGTWQSYTVEDGLLDQNINCLAQDADGRLWFGTDAGVSVYDSQAAQNEDEWLSFTTENGLPNDTIRTIATDPFLGVWVGTAEGLANFDGEQWLTSTVHSTLTNTEILDISVDDRGDVWVGTHQGVKRYNGQQWSTYTVDNGLLSNEVTAITSDLQGVMWFGTDIGLSRFDGLGWTSFTPNGGLQSGKVNTLMIDEKGAIWVGTENGASTYDGRNWRTVELAKETGAITAIAEDLQVNDMCPLCADIFYRHASNGGKTWRSPINLSRSLAGSVKPQVSVGEGTHVYVTWEEGEDWYAGKGYPVASMFTHSTDRGETWTDPIAFTATAGIPQQITLGVGKEGKLVVVWRLATEEIASRYYYQTSEDHGATWSDPLAIPGIFAKLWEPLSLDGYDAANDSAGNTHLLVLGYTSPPEENAEEMPPLGLYHLIWDGSAWSSPTPILVSSDPPEWPSIDVALGNQIYATWFTRDKRHIYDSERGRYKVWASYYEADAPFIAPETNSPETNVATPIDSGDVPTAPTSLEIPTINPEDTGLPPGLDTDIDDVGRLLVALSPIALILLVIAALRFRWFRHP